jgi:hypothetical protein
MRSQQSQERADFAKEIGDTLLEFLRGRPASLTEYRQVREKVSRIVSSGCTTPDVLTDRYRKGCQKYVNEVLRRGGLPYASITDTTIFDGLDPGLSVKERKQKFQTLIPAIRNATEGCVGRFQTQASRYFEDRMCGFEEVLDSFFRTALEGRPPIKDMRPRISKVKQEARSVLKWDELFGVLKQGSLVSELQYLFDLEQGPIAVVWHYSEQDEDVEGPLKSNHLARNDVLYAVRGNWAVQRDLMVVPAEATYIDDVTRPGQELGCMCLLEWKFGLRDLPGGWVTDKGQASLEAAQRKLAQLLGERTTPAAADHSTNSAHRPQPSRHERGIWARIRRMLFPAV